MKYIFLLAVVLLGLTDILAQEITIDKAEFEKVMFGSFQALKNTPYRTIEESEHKNSSGLMKTRMIRERLGINSRMIYESDSATLYIKTETIFINGKRFIKKLNNPWVEEPVPANSPVPSNYETISNETVYKSLGEGVLFDKKVKSFKTIETRNLINKEKGYESIWDTTTTYWFDESGVLVKQERISELTIKPKQIADESMIRKETKSVIKSTIITEIDPNIKIEEPQIG